eukprot:UC4_evm2s461
MPRTVFASPALFCALVFLSPAPASSQDHLPPHGKDYVQSQPETLTSGTRSFFVSEFELKDFSRQDQLDKIGSFPYTVESYIVVTTFTVVLPLDKSNPVVEAAFASRFALSNDNVNVTYPTHNCPTNYCRADQKCAGFNDDLRCIGKNEKLTSVRLVSKAALDTNNTPAVKIDSVEWPISLQKAHGILELRVETPTPVEADSVKIALGATVHTIHTSSPSVAPTQSPTEPPNPEEKVYITGSTIDRSNEEWSALISSGYTLVVRECEACTEFHKIIVYKRLTPWGDIDIRDLFLQNWFSSPVGGPNVLNVDFELYGSVENAVEGRGRWLYCNYNDPGIGFPRDCGPGRWTAHNWNSLTRGGRAVTYKVVIPPSASSASDASTSGTSDSASTGGMIAAVVICGVLLLTVFVARQRRSADGKKTPSAGAGEVTFTKISSGIEVENPVNSDSNQPAELAFVDNDRNVYDDFTVDVDGEDMVEFDEFGMTVEGPNGRKARHSFSIQYRPREFFKDIQLGIEQCPQTSSFAQTPHSQGC